MKCTKTGIIILAALTLAFSFLTHCRRLNAVVETLTVEKASDEAKAGPSWTGSIGIDVLNQRDPSLKPETDSNYTALSWPLGPDNVPIVPIVHAGSVPSTSDNLRIKLQVPEDAGATVISCTWTILVEPPLAANTLPSFKACVSTPQYQNVTTHGGELDLELKPIFGFYYFTCQGTLSTGHGIKAQSDLVEVDVRSDDVTIIAFLDQAKLPTPASLAPGVDAAILNMFPVSGNLNDEQTGLDLAAGLLLSRNWTYMAPILPVYPALTTADRNYIANWFVYFSADKAPPAGFTVPAAPGVPGQRAGIDYGYIDYSALNDKANNGGSYRLFSHLQLEYRPGSTSFLQPPSTTFPLAPEQINKQLITTVPPQIPIVLPNALEKWTDTPVYDRQVGITRNPIVQDSDLNSAVPVILDGSVPPVLQFPVDFNLPGPNGIVKVGYDNVAHVIPAQPCPSMGYWEDQNPNYLFHGAGLGDKRVVSLANAAVDPLGVRTSNTLRSVNLPPGMTPKWLESIGSQIRFNFDSGTSPDTSILGGFTQNFPSYVMYYNGVQVWYQAQPSIGGLALYRTAPYPFGAGSDTSVTQYKEANWTSASPYNSNNTPGGRFGYGYLSPALQFTQVAEGVQASNSDIDPDTVVPNWAIP